MPGDNHVIVTKRRYNGLKSLLLLILFSAEFLMIMGGDFSENKRAVYAFIAYILMHGLFMANSHSKNIYLKYEYVIALVIKTSTINVLVTLYLITLLNSMSIKKIIAKMLIISILNILSIVVVFIFVNWYTRLKCPDAGNVLHLYSDSFMSKDDSMDDIMTKIEEAVSDYEYIYLHNFPSSLRKRAIKLCFEKNKTVICTAGISDVLLRASGLAQDEDVPVYYCSSFGVGGISALIKRVFDLVCSIAALIILLPLFFIIALCIKMEDGGPVIYKQIRCTIDLKEFYIYKFRSMKENSEGAEAKLTIKNDKRLTKVGTVIRRFKLDELPQLINIIKGDMSIVGPRPERPELIKKAIQNTPEFVLRTKVKAGLTGYAQVRSRYDTKFKDKLLWDLMYIENFSFMLDLKIIIMTIFTIFTENKKDE